MSEDDFFPGYIGTVFRFRIDYLVCLHFYLAILYSTASFSVMLASLLLQRNDRFGDKRHQKSADRIDRTMRYSSKLERITVSKSSGNHIFLVRGNR